MSERKSFPKLRRAAAAPLTAALLLAVLLAGCATPPSPPPDSGQNAWEKGSDPGRDAPRWTRGGRPALKEAGVRASDVPKRYLVFVGVSEDRPDERGARFNAIENMFKQYAVHLQRDLDRLLPEAAAKAKLTLPPLNTALGAERSLGYLPREGVERDLLRASWRAAGAGPVYRVYVLGAMDREARRAHLLEAAKETFKFAMIRRADQEQILQEMARLVKKD